MNERRIDRQRYWLAYFFDGLPVGTQFKPGALHITIITWFVVEVDEEKLLNSFQSKFGGTRAFDVKIGDQTRFGPKNDVSVSLLEPADGIMDLHAAALEWFEEIGARWAVKNPHSGDEYKPHIRHRLGTELVMGETLHVDSLSIVKARRREDGLRTIAGRVDFDE